MNKKTRIVEFEGLLETVITDPLLKNRVIEVLKLNSFDRRSVLNIWLKQLRQQNAPQYIIDGLSYLFDDHIANEILNLINNNPNQII